MLWFFSVIIRRKQAEKMAAWRWWKTLYNLLLFDSGCNLFFSQKENHRANKTNVKKNRYRCSYKAQKSATNVSNTVKKYDENRQRKYSYCVVSEAWGMWRRYECGMCLFTSPSPFQSSTITQYYKTNKKNNNIWVSKVWNMMAKSLHNTCFCFHTFKRVITEIGGKNK